MARPSYATCDSVTLQCPVRATTYGYYPVLGVNSVFIAFFALCLAVQIAIGVRTRTWTYTIALGIGTFGEMVGYVGRVLMHYNPWNSAAFQIQICCLVLAPSFIAAAIYLTLKHLVLYCGPEHSRLKARLYPWIFIGCDFGSIVLQAIGGGVAASAGKGASLKLLNAGNALIIAGIAFQVATMSVCGILVADYFRRRRNSTRRTPGSEPKLPRTDSHTQADSKTRSMLHLFCGAVVLAYLTVLIRCIYRLPEMAGGWGNPRMRNEKEFLVLDGMMIALATLALTAIHPGIFFPPMRKNTTRNDTKDEISSQTQLKA